MAAAASSPPSKVTHSLTSAAMPEDLQCTTTGDIGKERLPGDGSRKVGRKRDWKEGAAVGLGIGQASSLPCFISEVTFHPEAGSRACPAHVSEQSCLMKQDPHMVETQLTHPVEQTTGFHEASDMGWSTALLVPWDLSSCLPPTSPWKKLPGGLTRSCSPPFVGLDSQDLDALHKCEEWSGSNSQRD